MEEFYKYLGKECYETYRKNINEHYNHLLLCKYDDLQDEIKSCWNATAFYIYYLNEKK